MSTYSGGMKRRLSVALAFLGDPKVVFLGEDHVTSCDVACDLMWHLVMWHVFNLL